MSFLNSENGFWPIPIDNTDDFPFVEHSDFFEIRVNYADPFGIILNKALDRLKWPERYILIFFEDAIRAEGLYTIFEARKVIDQLTIGQDGNYADVQGEDDSETKVFDAVGKVKPFMNEGELRELEAVFREYEEAKRNATIPWN